MSAKIPLPLTLLLDQGIPADAASLLRGLGYPCWHVSELGMQKAQDENILALALERSAVVITLDADFHALVAVRGLRRPSVVRLRRQGCRAETVVEILNGVLFRYGPQLEEGCLVSIREHRTTFHRLPVGHED